MKIFLKNNKVVDELEEEVTITVDDVEVTFNEVYYLDYHVDEDTGMIDESRKAKYYSRGQVVRNQNAINKILGI